MDQPITRAEHEEFVRRMQDEHKRIHHRVSDIEKTVDRIHDLTLSVERLATSVEQMARVQKSHEQQIERLEARDGEMWRRAVGHVVAAVIGVAIGLIFSG